MPENPVSPRSEAAVDRLTLSVDSSRGTEPSIGVGTIGSSVCFEAEPSMCVMCSCPLCFESE